MQDGLNVIESLFGALTFRTAALSEQCNVVIGSYRRPRVRNFLVVLLVVKTSNATLERKDVLFQ